MEFPNMMKFTPAALLATATLFAAAPATLYAQDAAVSVKAGQSLYGASGKRVASVYRVTDDGTVQVILDGKLISVPASTLSEVDGKVVTNLSRSDLRRAGR
jgi:hypothetical protein